MHEIGINVKITTKGALYIQDIIENINISDVYPVLSIDKGDELYEIEIDGHFFWLKEDEIAEV